MNDKYLKSELRTQIQGCVFISLRQANKRHSYVLVLQNNISLCTLDEMSSCH